MDRLQAIRVFREVARQGGFAAAARALNSSPPSVSRIISDLEDELGVRLFMRSTRQVGLTEEGEEFLRRGVPLLEELDTVFGEVRARKEEPRGHLKVSCVLALGQESVAPAVPGFMARYPEITVELDISNRKVDLVQEHFDLAIRIGGADGLEDSALRARRIFQQRLRFVATPGYVAEHGVPETLDDLSRHRVAKQVSGSWGAVNRMVRAGNVETVRLPDTFVVNSPTAARNAVLKGQAMGLLADYLVARHLASGSLVRVLPEYETEEQPIYAVFVHRTYMPAKVRTFIDYLVDVLNAPEGG